MLFHLLWLHAHHVLSLPILDHVEGLKSADDVFLSERGHFTAEEGGEEEVGGGKRRQNGGRRGGGEGTR